MAAQTSYTTVAVPQRLLAAAGGAAGARGEAGSSALTFSLGAAERRLSGLGCSTSGSSGGSSATPAWWPCRPVRRQAQRWPAFASLSTGGAAARRQQQDSTPAPPPAADADQVQPTPEQQEAARRVTAPDHFKPGDVIGGGRYRLVGKIDLYEKGLAEGRFTTVWDGEDLATARSVVLKLVEGGDGDSYLAGVREAALHAAAGRHPNIAALLDAFEHRSPSGRHACMVLEPCGTNLITLAANYDNRLQMATLTTSAKEPERTKQLELLRFGVWEDQAALKRIARHTLEALDHLHSRGLVHMDVSPDNLMLDKAFVPKDQVALHVFGHSLGRLLKSAAMLVLGKTRELEQQVSEHQAAMAAVAYNEDNLSSATVKLTDFGRCFPYKQLLPGLPDGAHEGAGPEAQRLMQTPPARLEPVRDGTVVLGDPWCRPPEEVLGLEYTTPAYDMWRLACTLFQVALWRRLFDASRLEAVRASALQQGKTTGMAGQDDNALLLGIMALRLGQPPRELARAAPPDLRRNYFHHGSIVADQLRIFDHLSVNPGSWPISEYVDQLSKDRQPGVTTAEEDAARRAKVHGFADFLTPMLAFDPAQRASAAEMLKHPWLQDGVEPAAGAAPAAAAGQPGRRR